MFMGRGRLLIEFPTIHENNRPKHDLCFGGAQGENYSSVDRRNLSHKNFYSYLLRHHKSRSGHSYNISTFFFFLFATVQCMQ